MHSIAVEFGKMISHGYNRQQRLPDTDWFEYTAAQKTKFLQSSPSEGTIYFRLFSVMYEGYKDQIRPDILQVIREFKFTKLRELEFIVDIFQTLKDSKLNAGLLDIILEDQNDSLKKTFQDIVTYSRQEELMGLWDVAPENKRLDLFFYFTETLPKALSGEYAWMGRNAKSSWTNYMFGCGQRGKNFIKLLKADKKNIEKVSKWFRSSWSVASGSFYRSNRSSYYPSTALLNYSALGPEHYAFMVDSVIKSAPKAFGKDSREINHFVHECIKGMKLSDRKLLLPIIKSQASNTDHFLCLLDDWKDIFGTRGNAKKEIQKYKNLL